MKHGLALLALVPALLYPYSYRDHTHYSQAFQETRNFRVYYPPDYDSATLKTYPVIYYLHGCGGTYQGDQYSSYSRDGHYTHPYNCTSGPSCDPVMNTPYNADFQMYVDSHDVIIVMVDGKLYGAGGCDVWVPYAVGYGWTGNEYNFSLYMRELFHAMDSLYRVKDEPRFRAISGLSMGGDASLWIASQDPHLLRSASSFCYSCSFKDRAAPPNTTPTDPQQFWRNYRGLSTRTHANTQDYLYQYSQQMGVLLQGAGFENEYHLAEFWRHWACDVDSQFDFHMRTFETPKPNLACFSYITPFPDFEVWGYLVASAKAEEGWIYLKDVTKNSLGIHRRLRFPYGMALSGFSIGLTTPPLYTPGAEYSLVTYDYRTGAFSSGPVFANGSGNIMISDRGILGREYGLSGNGLEPALALLADTVCDVIYLPAGADSALHFDLVNLSADTLSNVTLRVKSDNAFLTVKKGTALVPSLPFRARVRVDSAAVISGSYTRWENIGYIRVSFVVNGDTLDKEHVIQVHVTDSLPLYDSINVQVTNGPADTGKVLDVWISYPYNDVENNEWMVAATVPINGGDNPDVSFVGYDQFGVNRAREVVSAKIRLNRHPTNDNPVVLPFMTELVYQDPSWGSDKGVDVNVYRYGRIMFPFSAIKAEKGRLAQGFPLSVSAAPNPFTPSTLIRLRMPPSAVPEAMGIFSADGKRVRAFGLSALQRAGGEARVRWDGRDEHGRPLPSGVYLFRMTLLGKRAQTRIVYLR